MKSGFSTDPAKLPDSGAVFWLTGLSGAGKTTVANRARFELSTRGLRVAVLDGDELRQGLCLGLGLSPEDRRENVRRAGEAALLLASSGVVVIAALISPFREGRAHIAERVRGRGLPFAEIFVNAPLGECERRDPKFLYRRARTGELKGLTGLDAPYEPPLECALELHTDRETPERSAARVVDLVQQTLDSVSLRVQPVPTHPS